MAKSERRKGDRVCFEGGVTTYMMGIDGTWRRECIMEDVSETGAKLMVKGSLEGLDVRTFFLLLSSSGLAHRCCEKIWIDGDKIGTRFVQAPAIKNGKKPLVSS